ncbi:PDZ domain-containing protein [Tundrisphaera sp. TA3]|uniref:PDZ domain-containing protein n=1 Tax=Tundrisphaera sp. TA3 TaxID=3435775 RepID=UPI003EBB0F40
MLTPITASWLLAIACGLFVPAWAMGQESSEGGKKVPPDLAAKVAAARQNADEARAKHAAEVRVFSARAQAESARKNAELARDAARLRWVVNARGRSGVELAEISEAIRSQIGLAEGQGVVVVAVNPESPADKSGLKPNDLLLAIDDQPLAGVSSARDLIDRKLGKPAKVKIIRGGKEEVIALKTESGEKPNASDPVRIIMRKHEPTSSYWIGVPVSPVDATLRSHLTELPGDAGLIVNEVMKDSPAAKAGLAKNDVLIAIGGKPLTSPDVLMSQVLESEGKALSLEYLRGGKKATVSITPEKREVTAAEIKGNYLFQFEGRPGYPRIMIGPDGTARFPEIDAKAMTIEIDEAVKGLNAKIAGVGSAKSLDSAIKDLTAKVEEIRKAVEEIKKTTEELKRPDRE